MERYYRELKEKIARGEAKPRDREAERKREKEKRPHGDWTAVQTMGLSDLHELAEKTRQDLEESMPDLFHPPEQSEQKAAGIPDSPDGPAPAGDI